MAKANFPNSGKIKSILPSGKTDSSFFEQVFEVVRLVPYGRATTYGLIAAYLGAKSSARMVGWAMNAAHNVQPQVPAHRVVNRNGMLSGKMHFATPTLMEELLLKEGIQVYENQIINFADICWNPAKELI